ncbi:hypothetical protein [Anaeromicrobium sediminis]|uniref:Uncharacterized protein n=1 Tax=Anaeromicrobium sediminis TaxID=1478221 RepID=A0A267MJA0_9FIRM|nr:hypothetical protein [Anaeromicrobium sediminis]PAB59649.1 hypothetical protein CCE28_08770 [Anaeromicrobium sediminis]
MAKLYYCPECRKIHKDEAKCTSCSCEFVKPLKTNAPVNVIGTKQKGRVFKIKDDEVSLLVMTQGNEKLVKNYKHDEIQKVM